MANRKTQVVIAGGGPAGVMLGYLLARAGREVIVLEKWPDFFRDFRGDTIHPSTMELLRELGLLEEFLALPHSRMRRMTFHFGAREATIADFRYLPIPEKFIAFIPQWDFLTFLAQKARAHPTFTLLMATEATELIEGDGRITGVAATGPDGAFEIHADLVVGADGRHSTIRGTGGFSIETLSAPVDVLWFRVEKGGRDDEQSLGYLAAGAALIMLDRHEYWQCGYLIEKGRYEAVKAEGLAAFRVRVQQIGKLTVAQVADIDSWDKVKFLSVTVDHARAWAKEGVALIGDAAHAMSPIGGVGINYAIQDAVAAANILAPALGQGPVPLSTLRRIQARREAPTRKMQRLQVYLQDRALSPLLRETGRVRVPLFLRLFAVFPALRRIPSRIIGLGFLPEHVAPAIIAGSKEVPPAKPAGYTA